MYAPAESWDLESVVEGGVDGQRFKDALIQVKADAVALKERVQGLPSLAMAPEQWEQALPQLWTVSDAAQELYVFANGSWATNSASTPARLAASAVAEVFSILNETWVGVDARLDEATDAAFDELLSRETLTAYAPRLHYKRKGAKLSLPRAQEEIYVALEREALEGWGQLYTVLAGTLEADVDGKTLSIAEVAGLRSHVDEPMRRKAYEASQRAWSTLAAPCALALTHLTGARQTHYQRAGHTALSDTLYRNRVTPALLDSILAACEQMKPTLQRYLAHKAERLGKARLDWWDLVAPLPSGTLTALPYAQAQRLIAEAFGGFDPKLRDFAVHALKNRWVEAEQRGGKRQGGYCARLPLSQQSRIFMTYTGTVDSALTLAHELGHAYHNHLLFEVPAPRRHITSALAETASTFAEAVMLDQILETADPATQAFLLDQQLMNGVVFLMNIVARFRFEEALHRMRAEGAFDPELLSQTMLRCQQEAYGHALNSWDPTFWISKLHFYISSFGFYNWPYTFGYLFSAAVYQRAREEGDAFLPRFEELLRRTGWDDSTNIGRDVLGVDLEQPDFWLTAAKPLQVQLDRLIALPIPG